MLCRRVVPCLGLLWRVHKVEVREVDRRLVLPWPPGPNDANTAKFDVPSTGIQDGQGERYAAHEIYYRRGAFSGSSASSGQSQSSPSCLSHSSLPFKDLPSCMNLFILNHCIKHISVERKESRRQNTVWHENRDVRLQLRYVMQVNPRRPAVITHGQPNQMYRKEHRGIPSWCRI